MTQIPSSIWMMELFPVYRRETILVIRLMNLKKILVLEVISPGEDFTNIAERLIAQPIVRIQLIAAALSRVRGFHKTRRSSDAFLMDKVFVNEDEVILMSYF